MKRFTLVFMVVLLATACDSSKVFEQNFDLEDKTWNLDTIPSFNFETKDNTPKDVYINLRNTISYAYQNVYLSYTLSDSLGQTIRTDLINLQIFDEKTGKPFGNGNSVYEHQELVIENYQFPYQGKFTMKIAQYMREIDLKEIVSVGIRVEKRD